MRSSRWHLAVAATAAALALAGSAQADEPSPGYIISQEIVATWTCQDKLGVDRTPAKKSPWALKGHSRGFVVALLNEWELRHRKCAAALAEVKRQWNWQAWLPAHWYRVGSCETGYGGPPNWRHSNSSYQGAFGFATSSWDQFKLPGYPDEAWQATPWQQYQVALAIYNRYGMSGWGCKG